MVYNVELHLVCHERRKKELTVNFSTHILCAIVTHNKMSNIYCLLTTGFSSQGATIFKKINTFNLKYKPTNISFFRIAFVSSYFNEKHFHLKIESPTAETNSK
jgi:hypothetical protein